MIPQRIHDALIAILREHQPAAAAALLIDLEELFVRELAAEREACVGECDTLVKIIELNRIGVVDDERLNHLAAMCVAAERCAAAIRARTEGGSE